MMTKATLNTEIDLMSVVIMDIETAPLPAETLALVMPEFKAPANYKKQEVIDAYLNEAEVAWVERAALSATTGHVLAVGLWGPPPAFLLGPEVEMLKLFWQVWEESGTIVGFAIKNFDLPFLFRRSLANKVKVPPNLFEGRYWNRKVIDLQELWACYSRSDYAGNSLDAICACLGLGRKTGNGADFAKLLAVDKEAALEYLRQDLSLTAALAQRLGIIP